MMTDKDDAFRLVFIVTDRGATLIPFNNSGPRIHSEHTGFCGIIDVADVGGGNLQCKDAAFFLRHYEPESAKDDTIPIVVPELLRRVIGITLLAETEEVSLRTSSLRKVWRSLTQTHVIASRYSGVAISSIVRRLLRHRIKMRFLAETNYVDSSFCRSRTTGLAVIDGFKLLSFQTF